MLGKLKLIKKQGSGYRGYPRVSVGHEAASTEYASNSTDALRSKNNNNIT